MLILAVLCDAPVLSLSHFEDPAGTLVFSFADSPGCVFSCWGSAAGQALESWTAQQSLLFWVSSAPAGGSLVPEGLPLLLRLLMWHFPRVERIEHTDLLPLGFLSTGAVRLKKGQALTGAGTQLPQEVLGFA